MSENAKYKILSKEEKERMAKKIIKPIKEDTTTVYSRIADVHFSSVKKSDDDPDDSDGGAGFSLDFPRPADKSEK